MAEEHEQCHLWPNCEIHLGKAKPRTFSPANVEEMIEMRHEEMRTTEIAEFFGTSRQVVEELTNGKRKWQRIARRKGLGNGNDQ